jgi:uncharacterized protein (TIGR03000 family)
MYSVVLVMALAGSAEVPDCHGHARQACYGGGCYGGGYGGCYGGGYGGCYGRGYGGGCYGGGYGGCYGGYGGCYGGGYYYGPPKKMPDKDGEKLKPPKDDDKVVAPAPAIIIVTLPADAKLTIDGYVSKQTSSERRLVTPVLRPGQEFTYTLVAETMQDGQPISQQQRITVRAGEQTPVNFTLSGTPAAASR